MRTMLFSHIPFLVLKMRHDVSFQGTLLFWPTGLKNKVLSISLQGTEVEINWDLNFSI